MIFLIEVEIENVKKEIFVWLFFVLIIVVDCFEWEELVCVSINILILFGVSVEVGFSWFYLFGVDLVYVVGYVGFVFDYDLSCIDD